MQNKFLNKPWLQGLFLFLAFFATEFGGSKYFYFISIRNIVFIGMFTYIFFNIKKLFSIPHYGIVRFLILYYLFVAILGCFNDLYAQDGATLIFARFIPSTILIIFLFCYISTKDVLNWFINFLILFLFVNSIATILQGINHPIGWEIAARFEDLEQVIEERESLERIGGDTSIGLSIASGFFSTVVANGYFLASYGMLFLIPICSKRNLAGRLMSITIFVTTFLALFYCQQRMAFYSYLLATIFAFLYYTIREEGAYTIIFLTLILACFFVFNFDEKIMGTDLGRLANIEDATRDAKHALYWNEFFPNNFLLGNRTHFIAEFGHTPHNFMIEVILLGGIGGCIIFLLFIGKWFSIFITSVLKKYPIRIVFLGLPVLLIFAVSMNHSSGYHTGMSLGVYCLVIHLLSLHLYLEEFQKEKSVGNECSSIN